MAYRLNVNTTNPKPVKLVWVRADRLDELLAREYLVQQWTGGPRPEWFWPRDLSTATTFLVPEIYIRDEAGCLDVMVVNGRHRIRWLISRGDFEIPVAIDEQDEQRGRTLGLVVRPVLLDDVIP